MLKRFFLIVTTLAILAAVPAAAFDFDQKQFYGQGILALPMGDLGDLANIGFGAGFGIAVPHTPELSFRGELSYIYFTTEDFPGADVSVSMIPLVFLTQYNLPNSKAFLLGGLGLTFGKASVESTTTDFENSDTSTDFGLALGGGYAFTPKFGLEARLNIVSDANTLSLNGVYRF